MLINKIHLSNFKNFEDVEVDLSDMNVIVGANASGKTNFIEALQFIKDIKDFGIENAFSLHGGIEYLQNIQLKEKRSTVIEIHFQTDEGISIESSYKNTLYLNINNIIYSLEIILSDSGSYEIQQESFRYKTELLDLISETPVLDEYEFEFELLSKQGKITFESSLDKDITITSKEKTIIIKKEKISPIRVPIEFLTDNPNPYEKNKKRTLLEEYSFLIESDLFNFSIYDFDLKKAKNSAPIIGKTDLANNGENLTFIIKNILSNQEKYRQLANLLRDILPFIKGLNVERFYDKSLLLKVQETYNSNSEIPSSLLSDGTISITAIVIALFFENKNLAIFEEPEHGIHPALIAKLIQLFYQASKKKQVIITTHNPEILKHTRLEDLILILRKEDGFANISKPAEKEMVKAFLENELGIDQLFIQNLLDA
ncbi:AAA family ATPase [Parabacteroides sp. FAFU027]|uniref:AAA family ATPase n=1 Tax=Parabacteroides sp. FAFU027 TaxID=2922715 RepID=UPI001FAF4DA0|nr:AAA family ATPase [Parabacteroides sp. FAFU027]